ncbi:MAG: MBL fold metallo-hydrolase [Myxococcales bacterium]|nr:MBL fold metallo-hydrolase [Myxococcota bacterium]MDW8280123.1 MBL fold metallo-hydrolase [Myxococcales bacterium]
MLRIHVTGVGDAFTERYHNASLCLEEPASGFRLMIDCPPAFPRVLADYRKASCTDLAVDNIDHLLLTHLHGDHCGGTEAYLYLRRFVVGKKPVLHGAREVLDGLWEGRLRGGMEELLLEGRADGPRRHMELDDYCERQVLGPGATPIGPLLVERRFTIHHIPTTAVRVTVAGQPRPALGYSADTAFDPDLIAWLSEAELIIHETNFGVHTPLHLLAELPQELRARMRLIHYPDTLDVDCAPIRCLRQGEVIEAGSAGIRA